VPPRKHVERYNQIVGVLVDEGFDNALDWTGLRRFTPHKSKARSADKGPESVPERLRYTLERLGPTFVKIGQAASTRSDILPQDICDELRKLQDEVAPFPWEQARAVIEAELGAPVDELFAFIDSEPLAAASIGQVHAATLLDGSDVVVKVQRPGIRPIVEIDLDIVTTQSKFVADHSEIGEQYDVVAIIGEFAEAVHLELDYVQEARNAERLGDMFEGDDTVVFPKIYWDYTTSKVLTEERFVGIPFNRPDAIDEAGLSRPELAKRGIYAYLEQIFSYGFYQADPHPGNLLALPDGRVAFTDFGRVGSISKVGRDQLADLFIAIIDNDTGLAVDTLINAANAPGDIDVAELERAVSRLITKYYDKALNEVDIGELIAEVLAMVRRHSLMMSPELAVLLATLVVLEGLGNKLDPDFDFVSVTAPFARKIINERYQPQAMARAAGSAMRRMARLATDLPESLVRLVRRVGTGEMHMVVRPAGFEPIMSELSEASNRLSFAIVVAAFVIGLSFILSRTELPAVFVWVARVAWAITVVVGFWFFGSILYDRYRRK
jgi:ubiquinone biosynthesis protein